MAGFNELKTKGRELKGKLSTKLGWKPPATQPDGETFHDASSEMPANERRDLGGAADASARLVASTTNDRPKGRLQRGNARLQRGKEKAIRAKDKLVQLNNKIEDKRLKYREGVNKAGDKVIAKGRELKQKVRTGLKGSTKPAGETSHDASSSELPNQRRGLEETADESADESGKPVPAPSKSGRTKKYIAEVKQKAKD